MTGSSSGTRNLSLTEELEKLEQSITLTLQEIDHNFSKSHRIVTASILPLVEQYGEHSRAVWEASKFWKQFFEASANVSLSGYEDQANNEDETVTADESTGMREGDTTADYSADAQEDDITAATSRANDSAHQEDAEESLLEDEEVSGSTPRPPSTKTAKTDFANLSSPYETMKRQMNDVEMADGDETTALEDEDSTVLFAQRTARLPDMSMTPGTLTKGPATARDQSVSKQKDPLLHRVLDKNYRLQTTPHRPQYKVSPLKKDLSPRKAAPPSSGKKAEPSWRDGSPASSPEMAIPKLRSEAFMSPYKSTARQKLVVAASAAAAAPRTPGVSVQTPAAGKKKSRNLFAQQSGGGGGGDESAGPSLQKGKDKAYGIDWDSDEEGGSTDLYGGMSPPKTIQFALPQSKLLQTPAGEASRRIVEDILLDAGADPESSEYSPTMVKMNEHVLDDSF